MSLYSLIVLIAVKNLLTQLTASLLTVT